MSSSRRGISRLLLLRRFAGSATSSTTPSPSPSSPGAPRNSRSGARSSSSCLRRKTEIKLLYVAYPPLVAGIDELVTVPYRQFTYPPEVERLPRWFDSIGLAPATGLQRPVFGELTGLIYRTIRYNRREESGVQSPVTTLDLASGSCRDMAVLMIETARDGIPRPLRERLSRERKFESRPRLDPRLGRDLFTRLRLDRLRPLDRTPHRSRPRRRRGEPPSSRRHAGEGRLHQLRGSRQLTHPDDLHEAPATTVRVED